MKECEGKVSDYDDFFLILFVLNESEDLLSVGLFDAKNQFQIFFQTD